MSKKNLYAVTLMAVLGLVVSGCLTGGGGPTPEELIGKTLADWKTAIEAQDVDAAMALVSADYVGTQGGGKDAVQDFLENAKAQGNMADLEVLLDDAEITVDGDAGEAGPVDLSGSFGGFSLMLEFRKDEDEVWRISTMDQY
jgi:ketosteroid isomerase-like protein